MKKILTALISMSLLSCTSYKLTEPTEEDVEREKSKYPEINLQELKLGKTLYINHCGNCHKLFKPSAFKEDEWKKEVPKMVKKINKKAGKMVLSAEEEEKILRYLLVMKNKK